MLPYFPYLISLKIFDIIKEKRGEEMDKDEMELLTLANNVLLFPAYYSDIAVTLAQGIVDLLSKEQQQYEEIEGLKAELERMKQTTEDMCLDIVKKVMKKHLPELVEDLMIVKSCEEAEVIIKEL